MLKKSITLLAVVAVAGVAFATESAPSNTVGFVTVTTSDLAERHNHITIQPRGTEVGGDFTEIWGAQFIGGSTPYVSDLLEEYTPTGLWLNLWRLPMGAWVGTMAGIDHNKSYLFKNRHGSANAAKVFAGDVIPEGTLVDMGMVTSATVPGDLKRTFIANPLPMSRTISGVPGDLYNLIGSGFTQGTPGVGDVIEHYTGTLWTSTFNLGGNWLGTLTSFEPGVGYEIADMSAGANWNWTFTVGADVLAAEQDGKTSRVSSHK